MSLIYREIDTPAGILGFDIKNNSAVLSAHRGRDVSVVIPECITIDEVEYPVVAIGAKAFLSNKYLHEITVPSSIKQIDDWGFARCSNLEKIYLHRDIRLGNGVFLDCNNLKLVKLNEATEMIERRNEDSATSKKSEDVGYMLAAVIQLLDDRYLFDLQQAGSDEWIENWDHRMDVIMNTPDDDGFIALLACGEEDYEGRDNTLDGYLSKSRRRKIHVCMTRLLHDYRLDNKRREQLIRYLYEHRAGMKYSLDAYDAGGGYSDSYLGRISLQNADKDPSNRYSVITENSNSLPGNIQPMDETWRVVLEEHGDEEEYYQLIMDCGCVDADNLNIMLEDLGDKHARMKAYLLREKSTKKASDFFDSLDL